MRAIQTHSLKLRVESSDGVIVEPGCEPVASSDHTALFNSANALIARINEAPLTIDQKTALIVMIPP
jgi:hypothetical protein